MEASARPGWIKLLVGIGLFDALGGFAGGVPFLLDPSGRLLGVNVSMFPGLPVADFLLVGLWLFAISGVGACLIAYLLWIRHPWSSPLAILQAAIWFAWIVYELVLWGASSFIVPWIVPPIVVFALLALPTVRGYARGAVAQGSS